MTTLIPTTDTHKVCSQCYEVKPYYEFHNNKSRKDGKEHRCKQCNHERYKTRRAKLGIITLEEEPSPKTRTHKACSWCKEIKPLSEFHRRTRSKRTGRKHNCKKCTLAYTKSLGRYHARFTTKPETKTCCRCKITKPASAFGNKLQNKDTLRNECKDCTAKASRQYRKNSPTKLCKLCGNIKPRVEYPENANSEDKRWHICTKCWDKHSVNYGDIDTLVDTIREKRIIEREDAIQKTQTIQTQAGNEENGRVKYESILSYDPDAEKKCRTCNVIKHLSEFHKHYRYKDGHNTECGACYYSKRKKNQNQNQ